MSGQRTLTKASSMTSDSLRSPSGKAHPTANSTETARRTGTVRTQSSQIQQKLGEGCGNRSPFNRHKRSK